MCLADALLIKITRPYILQYWMKNETKSAKIGDSDDQTVIT